MFTNGNFVKCGDVFFQLFRQQDRHSKNADYLHKLDSIKRRFVDEQRRHKNIVNIFTKDILENDQRNLIERDSIKQSNERLLSIKEDNAYQLNIFQNELCVEFKNFRKALYPELYYIIDGCICEKPNGILPDGAEEFQPNFNQEELQSLHDNIMLKVNEIELFEIETIKQEKMIFDEIITRTFQLKINHENEKKRLEQVYMHQSNASEKRLAKILRQLVRHCE